MHNKKMMKYLSVICLLLISFTNLAFGNAAKSKEIAKIVNNVIAEKLQIDAESINLDYTFQAIGADALDLAEIVVTLEEKLNILIEDEKISIAAKTNDVALIPQRLSISQFIDIVKEASHQKTKEVEAPQRDP